MSFATARPALYYKAPLRYTLSLGLSALVIAGLCSLALLAGDTGSHPKGPAPRYAANNILSVRFVPQPVSSLAPSPKAPVAGATHTQETLLALAAQEAPAPAKQALKQIQITPIPSPSMPDSEPAVAVVSQPATAQGAEFHEIIGDTSIVDGIDTPNPDDSVRITAQKSLLSILESALNKELVYPAAARRAGVEGSVRLLLKITQSGDLETMKVIESSGSALLDRAAQRLARRIFPIAGDWPAGLETDVSIEYRLK